MNGALHAHGEPSCQRAFVRHWDIVSPRKLYIMHICPRSVHVSCKRRGCCLSSPRLLSIQTQARKTYPPQNPPVHPVAPCLAMPTGAAAAEGMQQGGPSQGRPGMRTVDQAVAPELPEGPERLDLMLVRLFPQRFSSITGGMQRHGCTVCCSISRRRQGQRRLVPPSTTAAFA